MKNFILFNFGNLVKKKKWNKIKDLPYRNGFWNKTTSSLNKLLAEGQSTKGHIRARYFSLCS